MMGKNEQLRSDDYNAAWVCLPLSCEPAATQFVSACRIPGKGRTSQRNPVND